MMLFESSSKGFFDHIIKETLPTENNIKFKSKSHIDFSRDNARILSCDKVNRQLFDSEVQLINALQNMKFKIKQVIKTSMVTNKIKVSNFNTSDIKLPNLEETDIVHLPDNIKSTKTDSGLISKIVEIRKLKFLKYFEEFHQSLGSINKKTENLISGLCKILNDDLSEINNQMQIDLQLINSSKNLNNLTRGNFNSLDENRKFSYDKQRNLIENALGNILQFESDRIDSIKNLLSKSSIELTRIGHLAPSEVHRIMSSILIEINLSIIENKETFHDLKTKLHMIVIDEDRKTHLYLTNHLCIWQKSILNIYLDDIKERIENETMKVPITIKVCMKNLYEEALNLSTEIQEIIVEIKQKMYPDVIDEMEIKNWNILLISIKNKFEKGCEDFLKESYGILENINQNYLNEMDSLKATISSQNIYDDNAKSSEIVDNLSLPLLGKFHSNFENAMHEIENIIEEFCNNFEIKIKKIENFLKFLWDIWKSHEYELKKTEESVHIKLNSASVLHQEQNLNIENEFNLMVDKMRQDPTEQNLKEDLKKCLNVLDKIKTSYTNFYNQQVHIVKKYPSLVDNDVKTFEEKILNYFTNYYSDQNNLQNKSDNEENNNSDFSEVSNFVNSSMIRISDSQFQDLVKGIENNLTSFIHKWCKTVAVNASKLVTIKIDELDSELKLRFHLHEPRYKRIEYDVHNVRSAELSIHSERVSKQCKGIESSLNSLMEDYSTLDRDHKVKQEQFKEKILSDEETFLNITNNSKLLNMRKMLEDKIAEYMKEIRVSIRNFRKNTELKLQKLRQSNSDFVRSFKLFSVGGNFCIEEIDEFSKRIEKVNKKIDDTEGEIMSNLEVIEKQQHDALMQFQTIFEEKFKFHTVDINFIDKLNRAFCNIQVKIKAEVSNSNSQSRKIFENINTLKSDFIEQSKSGKDQHMYIDVSVLEKILKCLTSVHDRCIYLDCIKTQSNPKLQLNTLENNDGISQNKVQFSAITVLSKGGRQPNEDQGLKTIKNLLQVQNSYLDNQSDQMDKCNKVKEKGFAQNDMKNNQVGFNSRSLSVVSGSMASDAKPMTEKSKLVNKNQRLEKKYLVFGDETTENNPTFLSKIRMYCKEILDGILYATELYYRNKGVRKVTHPSLQDSFDQAAEDIIFKLKYYFQQADEYYKECLQEFNKQLIELEKVINVYPKIMFSIMLEKFLSECVQSLEEENKVQSENFKSLSDIKTRNYSELRSDFGQPSKKEELDIICFNEESRQKKELELISKSFDINNNIVYSYGRQFVKIITNSTEQYLLLMDNVLTTDDVQIPELKVESVDTKDLIRNYLNAPKKDFENQDVSKSNKMTWISDDISDILIADKNYKLSDEFSPKSLINAKHTSCHDTIITERSKVVEKFKSFYFEKLSKNQNIKEQRLQELDNYKRFWSDSISSLQKFQVN